MDCTWLQFIELPTWTGKLLVNLHCLPRCLPRPESMRRLGAFPSIIMQSYDTLSRNELIAHIQRLEATLSKSTYNSRSEKPFNFSAYSTRKIALKFSYAGAPYHGLAFQNSPLQSQDEKPTVEGEIWKAVCKLKLVDETQGLSGCEWERCGRTDKGVSAAGQVLSLRVRTAINTLDTNATDNSATVHQADNLSEIAYVSKINRMLPPDIRILAWSPVSPTFSARFHCRARHYKYFFSALGLDVTRMRRAASLLIGEHDFRNMCKIDPAKQLTHFRRRVISTDVGPVHSEILGKDMHVFDLVGSAFLYHQVRHIMAILFLVGKGLEDESIVSRLLHTSDMPYYPASQASVPVIDEKPDYQMADGLPLMLWDCLYDEGDLEWQTNARETSSELIWDAQARLERSAIGTALEAYFLSSAELYYPTSIAQSRVATGGGTYVKALKHVPLLERKRLESAESQNRRWADRRSNNLEAEDSSRR